MCVELATADALTLGGVQGHKELEFWKRRSSLQPVLKGRRAVPLESGYRKSCMWKTVVTT